MTRTDKTGRFLLVLNMGSSSLKFAVFDAERPSRALAGGNVERSPGAKDCLGPVLKKAAAAIGKGQWAAIGHRIVHGGPNLSEPCIVGPKVTAELRRLIPFAPEHLPAEIALIKQVSKKFPRVPQVACFDTAFHRDLPRVAQQLPIPRRYESDGVRRYGFHGLSFEFLRGELIRLGDSAVASGRVILAHLGNGASMAALKGGSCVDTSMAFTPAAGLIMGTRSGDLDPGLLAFLAKQGAMSPDRLNRLVNHESGMLGVSGTSADMRALHKLEKKDVRAAEAVALFCQQAKKWIGSFAAVLGGLDTLVFAGGIGEHDAPVRARICSGLGFLGLELDGALNEGGAPIISSRLSRVTVRVIATDEELVIARAASRLLQLEGKAA